jgi:hypothetical protein
MALVQYGPIVSDARKKIAGVVATKGHAGNFMRKKVSPIQPRTSSQRNVRAVFSSISKAWQTITATAIAAFNALAKATPKKDRFGNTVTLTGAQLYMSLNRNLQQIAAAAYPLTAAPGALTATSPGTLTATAVHSTGVITITPAAYPATGEAAVVFAGPPISPGKTFVGKNFKFVAYFGTISVPPAVPYVITTPYAALFGAFTAGKKISVLVKHVNFTTGAAGIPNSVTPIAS